jgi:hypothetical protein
MKNEWRLIVSKTDNALEKIFYSPDSIEAIKIGYRSHWPYKRAGDEKLCKELSDVVSTKYKHINTYAVGPHDKEFKLYKRRLLINPEFTPTRIVLK